MSDGFTIKIEGMAELVDVLRTVTPRLRKRAILNSLRAAGRLIRDIAAADRRADANTANPVSQYRRHGTVAAAIAVRTSRVAAAAGDIGVFINVRPLKTGGGAHNPNDPFYWRFLEFGTKFAAARPFLQPAALHLADALTVFEEKLSVQVQKLETNGKDPL